MKPHRRHEALISRRHRKQDHTWDWKVKKPWSNVKISTSVKRFEPWFLTPARCLAFPISKEGTQFSRHPASSVRDPKHHLQCHVVQLQSRTKSIGRNLTLSRSIASMAPMVQTVFSSTKLTCSTVASTSSVMRS